MKIDPLLVKTDKGESKGMTHVVRHIQSDCAVTAFKDAASAETDAVNRTTKAAGLHVKATYDVVAL